MSCAEPRTNVFGGSNTSSSTYGGSTYGGSTYEGAPDAAPGSLSAALSGFGSVIESFGVRCSDFWLGLLLGIALAWLATKKKK